MDLVINNIQWPNHKTLSEGERGFKRITSGKIHDVIPFPYPKPRTLSQKNALLLIKVRVTHVRSNIGV